MNSIIDAQVEYHACYPGPLHAGLGVAWDNKLRNEQDPKFIAEVDGYRFVTIIEWPIMSEAERHLLRRSWDPTYGVRIGPSKKKGPDHP